MSADLPYLCTFCNLSVPISRKVSHTQKCDSRKKLLKLENLSYYQLNINEFPCDFSKSDIEEEVNLFSLETKINLLYGVHVNLLESTELLEETKRLLNVKKGGENRGK